VRRLVVYVGYDKKSRTVLRRVRRYKDWFDEVTIVQIPESRQAVLDRLSIPSVVIEEIK